MRNELRNVGLLSVVLMTANALSQTTPNAAALAIPILQGAALPRYPPIAKAAHITGKVIVRVTVNNGLVVKTDVLSKLDPRQRFLETPTVENLKTWRFAADVNGAFTLAYTYEISGKETEKPTNARVEILPSLDVKITARPVKPTVMYERQSSPSTNKSPSEPAHARN